MPAKKTKKTVNVFDKQQLKIAHQTLRMPDAVLGVIGGMTKDEARAHIKRITGKDPKD